MSNQQHQEPEAPSTHPIEEVEYPNLQTIQRLLNHSSPSSNSKECLKCCITCGIQENEIKYEVQTIIIELEGNNNEMYCDSCLQDVFNNEQIEVRKLEENFIYQKEFESSITESDILIINVDKDEESSNLIREVEELEQKEKELIDLLQKAENESNELQEKVHILEQREERFWLDISKLEKRALRLEEKAFMAKNQGEVEKRALENLSKTCIIQVFFKIEVEDNYAKICGLPIGKKPEQAEINWEEVNSGLGHLLLAYNYLTIKYGLTYTNLEDIRIKGHLSEIKLKNISEYIPVGYGVNTGSNIGAEKKFGIVMDSLLAEMAFLAQHIQEIENIEYSEELKLPYNIDKKEGKIVDLYVNPTKLEDKNKWSQWTKAMRYFLIDVKHLLAVVSLGDPYL